MSPVSSTSSASQYGWQQLKLQQAKRNADQAEQTAQTLKAQASDAQRVADRAQENARSLSVQSDQAQANAGQARQGLAALGNEQQAITQLSNTVDQVLARQQISTSTTKNATTSATGASTVSPKSLTPPVVNSQGQVTGKIINTTA